MSWPGLSPKSFYALRTEVKGNAHFITDTEILYPGGAVLLLHDYPLQTQRFIQLMEKSIYLEMMVVSPTRNLVAIIINDEKGQIIIYDVKTLKKKRTLQLPHDASTKRYEDMCFSHDEKLLLTLTGDPDWMMLSYNWEKGKVETSTRANYINNPGPVSQVLCSPTDSAMCTILGPSLLRLMSMQETVWRQFGFQKADQVNITSAAFLGGDRIVIGTSCGKLLLIDNGDLRGVHDAFTIDTVTVPEKEEGSTAAPITIPKAVPESEMTEDRQVRAMVPLKSGFAYSCGVGKVHLFERDLEDKRKYVRRNVFVISDLDFREEQKTQLNIVRHISVSPSQDQLLATTNRSQIYIVRLWGPTIETDPEIPFKHLGESLHHGPISGLALCRWKPLFMTLGAEDRTLRVWNYETGGLEMLKQYQEEVYSIALHPTGLFAAVGFCEKLRYTIVLLDDIRQIRSFPIPECRLTAFSSHGHYLAAVDKVHLQIYSTVTFQLVWTLKGHCAKVTSLVWTPDDRKLVSCGMDGAVYEWNITSGTRDGETVDKGIAYWGCAVTSDAKFVYAVGNDGKLKEMHDSQVLRTFKFTQKDLPHIVLAKSDQIMFVCGESGLILSVKLPLIDPIESKPFLYHNAKILKMRLTEDDKTLITVSEKGSLCLWDVTDAEGKTVELDPQFTYCDDVLIPKTDLEEKVSRIKELSQRKEELVMEHEYAMRQTKASNEASVKQINGKFTLIIEELQNTIDLMAKDHKRETTNMVTENSALRDIHQKAIQDMENDYNQRLIAEYDKYSVAQAEKEKIVAEYEQKLIDVAVAKDNVIEGIKNELETKIKLLQADVDKAKAENSDEKMEHEEIKQQIEDDADREIVELKAKYEQILKEEKDMNVQLRGESGVLKKKLLMAHKENEKYKQEISQLEAEQRQFQEVIQGLEKDINELKREIYERDLTIQDKEKRIYDMKKNNEELEKYKFVLTHKIEELKNQLEPKELELSERDKQILEMEHELEMMELSRDNLEVKIKEVKEKHNSEEQEVRRLRDKNEALHNTLTKIKVDIIHLANNIQDFAKLKTSVKHFYEKYAKGDEVARAYEAQINIEQEFMRQRIYLEQTIATLRDTLAKTKVNQCERNSKTVQENVLLLEEINSMRRELATKEQSIERYERVLLTSSGKLVSVKEAHKRIQQALKSQQEIRDEMAAHLEESRHQVTLLKCELERLKNEK